MNPESGMIPSEPKPTGGGTISARWMRLQDLFDAAKDLPATEQRAFVNVKLATTLS